MRRKWKTVRLTTSDSSWVNSKNEPTALSIQRHQGTAKVIAFYLQKGTEKGDMDRNGTKELLESSNSDAVTGFILKALE